MIGIRVDANSLISTGHVMRCIAVEQGLQALGQKAIFFVADLYSQDFLRTKGHESVCLESDWRNKEEELTKLIKYIQDYKINKLIVDSYQVTKGYFEELKKWTKVIYIDDLNKDKYPLNMLVNYGLNISEEDYKYEQKEVKLLLGRKYVLLRQEFRDQAIIFKEHVTDVLITTGGSDNLCIVEQLIKKIITIKSCMSIRFHIVVGNFFINRANLEWLVDNYSNLFLYYDVKDMSKIMLKCDIAISAGGTTLAELCALGIPTICFAIADNQISGVEAYQNAGVMISIGDVRKNVAANVDVILHKFVSMVENNNLRSEIYRKVQGFIDGNGAIRIAESILKL